MTRQSLIQLSRWILLILWIVLFGSTTVAFTNTYRPRLRLPTTGTEWHINDTPLLGRVSTGISQPLCALGDRSKSDALQSISDENNTISTAIITTSIESKEDSAITSRADENGINNNNTTTTAKRNGFDIRTALFVGGLAFDAYVEPPPNSSRWERGSKGWQVAFCSPAFTRHLYKGLIAITVHKITDLPGTEDNMAERILTGSGVDACLLVAVLEGTWKEDVERLENEQYHEGVLDLLGAAHVGRSTTAWSSVREKESIKKRPDGSIKQLPYHVPATWGRGAQAIWPKDYTDPFYLYVQDPATARLVFTVLDDDRVGSGTPIGSTHKRLAELIPAAKLKPEQILAKVKVDVLQKVKSGEMNVLDKTTQIELGAATWEGVLKLTSKPRKRDKNGQMWAGAAAGAMVAGPAGAATGALLGIFYEGEVRGRVEARLRYLPIPPVKVERKTYRVTGGMPGIDWGSLFKRFHEREGNGGPLSTMDDLEHCFFVNHQKTGATCAVYRSLKRKLIIVSFRGTCAPIDLLTDANLVQEAWVEGEDIKNQNNAKVHSGFRSSLNSIARRLKELILATPAPGDSMADYDMLVTGHSLGGALATLFVADVGQYGIDAGRALPQLAPSEPWWMSIASTLMGQTAMESAKREPPRPKSIRLYNFGSPRVGNQAFADLFDKLCAEGHIDQAYRIVNGDDVVARMPRSMNALVFGNVGYEHVGTTVLISQPKSNAPQEQQQQQDGAADSSLSPSSSSPRPLLWIEGESDDSQCPVRDGQALTSPMAEGSLLADLIAATKDTVDQANDDNLQQLEQEQQSNELVSPSSTFSWSKLSAVASKMTARIQNLSPSDVVSLLGIDKRYTEREVQLIQSLLQGKALAHHLEDQYYAGMGRACGFLTVVGDEIRDLDYSSS